MIRLEPSGAHICGIWGTFSLGLFAAGNTRTNTDWCGYQYVVTGLFYGGDGRLKAQMIGSFSITIATFVVLDAADVRNQVRVPPAHPTKPKSKSGSARAWLPGISGMLSPETTVHPRRSTKFDRTTHLGGRTREGRVKRRVMWFDHGAGSWHSWELSYSTERAGLSQREAGLAYVQSEYVCAHILEARTLQIGWIVKSDPQSPRRPSPSSTLALLLGPGSGRSANEDCCGYYVEDGTAMFAVQWVGGFDGGRSPGLAS